MTRRKVTATELKNYLGAYLEAAIAAPVFVEKSGREVVVLMSHEHYTSLYGMAPGDVNHGATACGKTTARPREWAEVAYDV